MTTSGFLSACIVALLAISVAGEAGDIKIARDLYVAGKLTAKNILTKELKTTGDLNIGGLIKTDSFEGEKLSVDTLEINSLNAGSGGTITVEGNLVITSKIPNSVAPEVNAISLLAEDVIIGGVKQWKLVRHEDFQTDADGWSFIEASSVGKSTVGETPAERSNCGGVSNLSHDVEHHLGGHCLSSHGELRKMFNQLPPHTQVKVQAQYHFIDNWQGETGYAKADDQVHWTHHTTPVSAQHGIEMCGAKDFKETKFSTPVEFTMSHKSADLQLAFGSSTLQDDGAKDDPCQRSFAVDNVMIYVK